MASEVSSNFPDLMNVGSMVKFATKSSEEYFTGTVYFVNPEDGSFGIDDVLRTLVKWNYRKAEGFFQFSLKDVKDLRVIVPGPTPPTTTNTTTKDDKKSNPGDASSSNTTKDDHKSNPGDASSSTSPSK